MSACTWMLIDQSSFQSRSTCRNECVQNYNALARIPQQHKVTEEFRVPNTKMCSSLVDSTLPGTFIEYKPCYHPGYSCQDKRAKCRCQQLGIALFLFLSLSHRYIYILNAHSCTSPLWILRLSENGKFAGLWCEKYCSCSRSCRFKYPGCSCKGKCETRGCLCVREARDCDPDVCQGCFDISLLQVGHGDSFFLKKKM